MADNSILRKWASKLVYIVLSRPKIVLIYFYLIILGNNLDMTSGSFWLPAR